MVHMKELIVAYGLGREIARDGDMPWGRELPADLWHFRDLTLGKSAIMGYNTYRSIGRKLPDRENIVVTSKRLPCGVLAVRSLEEAYARASSDPIIIGGGQLYAAALPDIDRIYATEVQAEFPGSDVFFPELPDAFAEITRIVRPADERNAYDMHFVTYESARLSATVASRM